MECGLFVSGIENLIKHYLVEIDLELNPFIIIKRGFIYFWLGDEVHNTFYKIEKSNNFDSLTKSIFNYESTENV